MAVTVVRGLISQQEHQDSKVVQPSANHTSLSHLVTRASSTDAAIVRLTTSTSKGREAEKVREYVEANFKANELSERIREEGSVDEVHTDIDPRSATRALSNNS